MRRPISLKRKVLYSALVSAATLLITAALLEMFLRLRGPRILPADRDAKGYVIGGLITADPRKGKRMVPGADVVYKNHVISGRDISIKINSLGFRDEDLPLEKPTHEIRILVLGDSITLADYLPEGESFVSYMQARLNRESQEFRFQVVNAGVNDIGMAEEIGILKDSGLLLDPDVVIIAHYHNDSRPPWGFPEELGSPGWLRRNSVLADWINRNVVLQRWQDEKGIDPSFWNSPALQGNWKEDTAAFDELILQAKLDWGSAWRPEAMKNLRPLFMEFGNLAKNHDFIPWVVYFPVVFEVDRPYQENLPQQRVRALCEELNLQYLDLLAPIKMAVANSLQRRTEKPLYFDHCHPRAPTNEAIGNILAEDFLNYIYPQVLKKRTVNP